MPDEDFLGESLRKIAKGAGVSFVGAFAGLALGYLSRMIIARWLWYIRLRVDFAWFCRDEHRRHAFFTGI